MDGITEKKYLHPLTLEAGIFLESLMKFSGVKELNCIDENMLKTMENVIEAINDLLERSPVPIVETAENKFVSSPELQYIDRIYYCNKCKVDLGKSVEKAALHLIEGHGANANANRKTAKKTTKQNNMQKQFPRKCKALLSNDILSFCSAQLQSAEILKAIPDYLVLEKELLDVVTPLFPDKSVRLYKFGSRMTGIATRNSDLDIFIDIGLITAVKDLRDNPDLLFLIISVLGKTFNVFEDRASSATLDSLYIVCEALKSSDKWRQIIPIDNARVPILKVCNASTKIQCDIGFSNSLGYCNTELLLYFFEVQPISRYMCIFLKKWFERSKLDNQMTTYGVSLMVIYFLQICQYLPSVEQLQVELTTIFSVGPWLANFIEKPLSTFQMKTLDITQKQCKDIMENFFNFYAKFDFANEIVCPYLGKKTNITDFENVMPQRYMEYVKKTNGIAKFSLTLKTSMVVQDPLQLNHNVTKNITPAHLGIIKSYFKQSAGIVAKNK